MRKKLTERQTPLELHDVSESDTGVLPHVRVTGSPEEVVFRARHGSVTYSRAFSLSDEAAVRELRDQLDAWLDDHGEAEDG